MMLNKKLKGLIQLFRPKLSFAAGICVMVGEIALRTSAFIFFLVVVLGFLPIILGWLDIQYLLVISAAGVVVAGLAVKLIKSRNSEEGRRIMRWLYLGPLCGLLVITLGQFMT